MLMPQLWGHRGSRGWVGGRHFSAEGYYNVAWGSAGTDSNSRERPPEESEQTLGQCRGTVRAGEKGDRDSIEGPPGGTSDRDKLQE